MRTDEMEIIEVADLPDVGSPIKTHLLFCVYWRKSKRHNWTLLIERSLEFKDRALEGARGWLANLDDKWLPTELGMALVLAPTISERTWSRLPKNAPVTHLHTREKDG
jgi:hypothetical protein